MRLILKVGIIGFLGLINTIAQSQTLPTDAAGKKAKCATIGLLYHTLGNGDSSIAARQFAKRNGYSTTQTADFIAPTLALDKKWTTAGDVLEKRYGKATTAKQIAEATALAQGPTRVWLPLAEECLK